MGNKISCRSPAAKRIKAAKQDDDDLWLLDDNLVVHIGAFLSAEDLVNLSRTCSRFGGKRGGIELSLAEASARSALATMTTEERNALPRYDGETLTCLLKELEVHRSPLFFDQLIGKNIFHQGDSRSTVMANAAYNVAISNQVMRGGKHYATFTDKGPNPHFYYGIIRPIKGWGDKRLKRFDDDHDENVRSELLAERTDRWGDWGDPLFRWGWGEIHCCEFNYRTLVGWYTGWERGARYHGYHWCYEDEVLEERAVKLYGAGPLDFCLI